jgi:hypothetical protein
MAHGLSARRFRAARSLPGVRTRSPGKSSLRRVIRWQRYRALLPLHSTFRSKDVRSARSSSHRGDTSPRSRADTRDGASGAEYGGRSASRGTAGGGRLEGHGSRIIETASSATDCTRDSVQTRPPIGIARSSAAAQSGTRDAVSRAPKGWWQRGSVAARLRQGYGAPGRRDERERQETPARKERMPRHPIRLR